LPRPEHVFSGPPRNNLRSTNVKPGAADEL
jgi:hypothetical protein